MINVKTLFQELVAGIDVYDKSETRAIVSILLQHVLGVSQSDILAGRQMDVSLPARQTLDNALERLNRFEPIQYVLGVCEFFGRSFYVSPSVLIPRPETEDIIRVVIGWRTSLRSGGTIDRPRILDIGTGSGCLSVTLSLEWPSSDVYALDVSRQALEVASENARRHDAVVNFIESDILTTEIPLEDLDVVVSNPPYVTRSEKQSMHRNVLDFEPHVALFVPDDDPLIFYRAIARKAKRAMRAGGLIALEIHERYGKEVSIVLENEGWKEIEVLHDVSGKPRVVKALV